MAKLILDDVTLHYQQLGQGEDLILVHGLGANLAFWYLGIASELAKHYKVLIYDLRGHGDSSMPLSGFTLDRMAQDLQALLDHLDISRPHIIGHSFGAGVALHYTLSNPHKVTTLTIADTLLNCLQTPPKLKDWFYWDTWKQQLQQHSDSLPNDEEIVDFRLLTCLNQISSRLTQGDLSRSPRSPSLKRRDMGRKGAARWEQLLTTTTANKELDDQGKITIQEIQSLKVPTLAIYGEYSHCLPSCFQLQKLLENCQVFIVPEVGHFHPAIKPTLFVQTLQSFLDSYKLSDRIMS
jgi:pimeloyl-ACP methyl ester carboxylesterase